jgi:hypothetical protein
MISEYPLCKCGHLECDHFTIKDKLCIHANDKVNPCHCVGFDPVPKENISKPKEEMKKI